MEFLNIAVLSVIQGITEFLPISSSGHLILVPALTGWPDQGLAIDAAVHVGTLGAVIVYFWRDLVQMIRGLSQLAIGRRSPAALLALNLVIGTIPVVVGFLFRDFIESSLRAVEVIAWATIGFGVLLLIADRFGLTMRRLENLGLSDAVIIGLAQVLALVPGTSRSGITMTAARLLGYQRADAARFSMLLSIPVIAGAGVLIGLELQQAGNVQLGLTAALASLLAFCTALLAIAFLMRWLRSASFMPFVVYRLVLGAGLLAWLYL